MFDIKFITTNMRLGVQKFRNIFCLKKLMPSGAALTHLSVKSYLQVYPRDLHFKEIKWKSYFFNSCPFPDHLFAVETIKS